MAKKNKPERLYKVPIVICRGCGKECPSIRNHLKRKPSCHSMYTKKEHNEFALKAKEVFKLNIKYDPIIKERE